MMGSCLLSSLTVYKLHTSDEVNLSSLVWIHLVDTAARMKMPNDLNAKKPNQLKLSRFDVTVWICTVIRHYLARQSIACQPSFCLYFACMLQWGNFSFQHSLISPEHKKMSKNYKSASLKRHTIMIFTHALYRINIISCVDFHIIFFFYSILDLPWIHREHEPFFLYETLKLNLYKESWRKKHRKMFAKKTQLIIIACDNVNFQVSIGNEHKSLIQIHYVEC